MADHEKDNLNDNGGYEEIWSSSSFKKRKTDPAKADKASDTTADEAGHTAGSSAADAVIFGGAAAGEADRSSNTASDKADDTADTSAADAAIFGGTAEAEAEKNVEPASEVADDSADTTADEANKTVDTTAEEVSDTADTPVDEAAQAERPADEYDDSYGESLFLPIDVSEPRAPFREMDIIEEALAVRRRDWIRTHISYLYAVVGVIIVAVIAFIIYLNFQSSNPMSRFSSSITKNFNSSFSFDIQLTENGKKAMSYSGAIDVNRSKHTIQAAYEADYDRYQYSGAVYADRRNAKKGSYYDKQWLVRDCLDNAQDFFDFDRDFRSGNFDAGAFLRFTGLTSDFSTRELNKFVNTVMKRLTTDSTIATVTAEKADGETRFHYDVSLQGLFEMVRDDGASIFYRATDYDKFCAEYEINKGIIEKAKCTIDFTVDGAGHMTGLEVKMNVQGVEYAMDCRMSDFGEAEVEVPQGFLKAASIELPE